MKNRKRPIMPLLVCFFLFCSSFTITASDDATSSLEDLLAITPTDASSSIAFPRSTVPALTEEGSSFTITIETKELITNAQAIITTAYEPIVDTYELLTDTPQQNGETTTITATIPTSVHPELYNLTIIFETTTKETLQIMRPRAVNVYDTINDTFTFIHITDFHYGDLRGLPENPQEIWKFKNIKKAIQEINLLQPDFVIISGDLVFGQFYPFEYSVEYPRCYELLQTIDAPTFLAPGNHDCYRKMTEDGEKFWQEYFGPLNYSFDFGDFHFISVNSYNWPVFNRLTFMVLPLGWGGAVSTEQLDWIETDLSSHEGAEKTFMFLHHNPYWDTISENLFGWPYKNRLQLLDIIQNHNVDMVLGGHVHWDDVVVENDTIYLTTTTPESSLPTEDGYWGYRLIHITDGEITSYNYKEPKYSIPSYHLNITQTANQAIIQNDLEKDYTIQVSFVQPIGNYTVSGGTITLIREQEGQAQVYIDAIISAQSEHTIEITRQ